MPQKAKKSKAKNKPKPLYWNRRPLIKVKRVFRSSGYDAAVQYAKDHMISAYLSGHTTKDERGYYRWKQ